MKRLITTITTMLILASCKTSKDYLAKSHEDKTLFEIVKELGKKKPDPRAAAALPEVYTQLQQDHLARINRYRSETALSRWDKIAAEYYAMQNMYDAVINNSSASSLVTATDYRTDIEKMKNDAAGEYYMQGATLLDRQNREDAKSAYAAFKKADDWVKGYKDVQKKIQEAKDSSIINVVINPVQDNSFFFNTSWNGGSFDLNNDNIPQNLVRDLGGNSTNRYPARFYTNWQAERAQVQQGWLVNIVLRNVDMPRPSVYNYTRSLSRKVEAGQDTAGHTIYQTVRATLHIQRQSFTARAQMDMNITDMVSRKDILFDSFNDSYGWQQEVATYSGDSRALSDRDWELVNNRYNMPAREEVLSQLFKGLYPQLRNRIANEADW